MVTIPLRRAQELTEQIRLLKGELASRHLADGLAALAATEAPAAVAVPLDEIDVERLARALTHAEHGTEPQDRFGRLIGWAYLTETEQARITADAERIARAYRDAKP